jgi:NTE family protein
VSPNLPIQLDGFTHRLINETRALGILLFGAPNFFVPRFPSPLLFPPRSIDSLSLYDVAPVRATLQRIVDFDLLNNGFDAPERRYG